MAEDIPGENNTGPSRHDEPLFAMDEVSFHGQVVAIVVGDSIKACREAAALVEVEYEPLPPVLGIVEAVQQQSFHTEPHILRRGDCTAALAAAPETFAGEFESGSQEHFYLETQAAWAEAGEDDSIVVHSSTQHPSEIQAIVCEVLALPRNKVVVQSPRMGGGFGGKETQGNSFAAMVALAAKKTGRPVRLQLDRDLDMQLTGKRHPFHAKFTVGHDAEGRILAAQVALVSDGGWSLDLSQPIADRAIFHLDNAYYIPAVEFTSRVARTNVTSHTAFRGFGGPQGMLVMEEIMDRIARRTGLPPEVVRERNLYHATGETNRTHYLEDIGDNRIQTMWEEVMTLSHFAKRRAEIAEWNRTRHHVKRGLAVTPVKFGISFTLSHYNQAGALVHIYQDGTVQVNHGGTEMGQGLNTKVAQVVAHELGVPFSAVRVCATDTQKIANTSATAASTGSDLNGKAAEDAARQIRERLVEFAAARYGVPPGAVRFRDGTVEIQGADPMSFRELVVQAYMARVQLWSDGFYATPGLAWNKDTMQGHPFFYFAYGAAVSEVVVDTLTGEWKLLAVHALHDAGRSLNPAVDLGQVEGGFIQGMGWLTMEELVWHPDDGSAKAGLLTTHAPSTYKIPTANDCPARFDIRLWKDGAGPASESVAATIHRSKATGEPPLLLPFSVFYAIRDAVSAAGGHRVDPPLTAPATSEAILRAVTAVQAEGAGQ